MKADEKILSAIRLARAGYGSPEAILATRADIVVAMIVYEKFRNDYEKAFYSLNRPSMRN